MTHEYLKMFDEKKKILARCHRQKWSYWAKRLVVDCGRHYKQKTIEKRVFQDRSNREIDVKWSVERSQCEWRMHEKNFFKKIEISGFSLLLFCLFELQLHFFNSNRTVLESVSCKFFFDFVVLFYIILLCFFARSKFMSSVLF